MTLDFYKAPRPDFFNKRLCADVDSVIFYPEIESQSACSQAKAMCAKCPVKQECLEYALENREPYGVWGGYTTRERLDVHDQRQREGIVPIEICKRGHLLSPDNVYRRRGLEGCRLCSRELRNSRKAALMRRRRTRTAA